MRKLKLLCLLPIAAMVLTGCEKKNKNKEPEQQQPSGEGEGQGGQQGGEGEGGGQQQLNHFEGLSLTDLSVYYDGQPHSIAVAGELPAGATVDYGANGNTFTEAGTYQIVATVSCEGYESLTLNATLTIKALQQFEGLSFNDAEVIYDGQPHSISVTGELPAGAQVEYGAGNSFTNVGVYDITATISCEGYETLVLHATLTIIHSDFVGISFSGATVTYDGQEHSIAISGELPEGAQVEYSPGNTFTLPGVYEITATITCQGYETLVLHATLTINKADFVGLTMEDATVTYDGNEHSISVQGELPAGASVNYGAGNSFTHVGVYEITATITATGYNDLVLHATLTIVAANFEGLTFENATVTYDGNEHSISVQGELPAGATIDYGTGNSFTNAGTYAITATISCQGYNQLVLNATLTINKADFVGITFDDGSYPYDGTEHSLDVSVPLEYSPTIVYNDENGNNNNAFSEFGVHPISVTVSQTNYNDWQGSATLTIGPAGDAEVALNVIDFEDMSDNDLADEIELKFYNNGWVDPSAAKVSIEKNQAFAGGTNTMKMTLTHQGSAFKATKEVAPKTYAKYKGFSLDTMMDSRAENGTMKLQVQFWFKDLPLPEAYQGYANTYATYTLSENAPSIWTHWEIPFDDDSLSIASNATITQFFVDAGYTVEEFSPYIDKVAIIITPNYKDGANCYAYIDNVKLTTSDETLVDKLIYGGKYVHIENENIYGFELADNLETGSFTLNGAEVSPLIVEKEGTIVVAKDTATSGAAMTVTARIEDDGSLTVISVQGAGAASYSALIDMNFAKHANVNLDFTGATTGQPLQDSHWYQEYWNESWLQTSGKMNVRGTAADPHCNMTTGYYMDYRYTYTYPEHFGLANKFSVDISNDFTQGGVDKSHDIKLKAKLISTTGAEIYVAGSSSEYQLIPASTAKWLHIEKDIDEVNVRALVIVVKSTNGSGNDYLYFDNLKLSYEVAPAAKTVADGKYFVYNSAEDAYTVDIAGSSAIIAKLGAGSFSFNLAVNEEHLTFTDDGFGGSQFVMEAEIVENNEFKVTSCSGSYGSAFSASLVNKTFRPNAYASLDFADGTTDQYYQESHWKESKYTNSGWTEYAAPQNMRSKVLNGNKIVNMYCSTSAINFRYSPDVPFGPVNHVSVDLGNYWASASGALRYKISILDPNGNVAKYVAGGEGSNWATLEKDASAQLHTFDFYFEMIKGYTLRITTSMESGQAYLYMDNLVVNYQTEPAPVFVPTGDLAGGARIKCLTQAGSDTGYVTELNVGGAGNADFSGTGVYLRMKNNTGVDTPITMKFNSTNGTLIGPKPNVDHTYYDVDGNEIAGIAARTWGNYLMLPANFDGFIYMSYADQMSKIQGDNDFDPAHIWRVYIEYSGFYDNYADFEIGDIFTDTQRVLDGSELDASGFAATWINQTGAVQEVSQLEGGVVPNPVYNLENGYYYIWNGSADAFRLTISGSTGVVTKVGGDSYDVSVDVDDNEVTIKDMAYSGSGLTISATLTADNTMLITAVDGLMASALSGSLLNKTVKHCAGVDLTFEDGTTGSAYKGANWSEQKYTSSWVDVANPEMNCRADDNGSKVVNMACDGSARNFIYDMDLPMGPVNHIDIDLGNYFSSSSDPISYKIAIIDGGGNKFYAAGSTDEFATIAKDTSNGNALKHFSLDFNLCMGDKLQITTKAAGSSYLYMDNVHISYRNPNENIAYKLVDTSGFDINDSTPEFYAWVWGGNDAGHWEALELKTDDGYYFDLTLFQGYTGMKIVRVNPESAKKPVVGSTKYGSYTNEQVWNETANIALNGTAGNVNFSF